MSAAELTRAEVEGLIAAAPPGQGVDLADRSLNGLDLSGLDLTGADLTRARLNRAKLVGTRLDGAKLDMSWGIEADLSGASLKGAAMFQAQFPRARLDRADLSGARIIGSFEGGEPGGGTAHGRRRGARHAQPVDGHDAASPSAPPGCRAPT